MRDAAKAALAQVLIWPAGQLIWQLSLIAALAGLAVSVDERENPARNLTHALPSALHRPSGRVGVELDQWHPWTP